VDIANFQVGGHLSIRYNENIRRKHPRYERIALLERFMDQNRNDETVVMWWRLMTHSPLYRNQKELQTLMEYTESMVDSFFNRQDIMISDKNQRKVYLLKDLELLRNFYLKPAVKKVLGLDWEDWESYLRRRYMGPSTSNWTLGIPPKAEDFEEWFNDEKTGKPVAVSPPRASRAVERQRSASPSKTAKRSSSDKGEA
jgi:hypothetical protein